MEAYNQEFLSHFLVRCREMPDNNNYLKDSNIQANTRNSLVSRQISLLKLRGVPQHTIEQSITLFDHFLSKSRQVPVLKPIFLVCAFISSKSHRSSLIDVDYILSQIPGTLTVDSIFTIESHVENTLNWHTNPPTVSEFIACISNSVEIDIPPRAYDFSFEFYKDYYMQQFSVCCAAIACVTSALELDSNQHDSNIVLEWACSSIQLQLPHLERCKNALVQKILPDVPRHERSRLSRVS